MEKIKSNSSILRNAASPSRKAIGSEKPFLSSLIFSQLAVILNRNTLRICSHEKD